MIWDESAALAGLAGGVLIGLASVLMLLINGRIAGISGLTGRLLTLHRPDAGAVAFVAGLVLAPWLMTEGGVGPSISLDAGAGLLALSGVIVGVGVALGSGCTSGHGVCGVSRLSPRSIAATGVFMAVGVASASLLRPLLVG